MLENIFKSVTDFFRRTVQSPLVLILILVISLLLIQWQTVVSLIKFWLGSFTYGHGLLVTPLCFYLIWVKRFTFHEMEYSSSRLGFVVFILLYSCWWFAYLVDVEIVQQISFLLLFAAIFWSVLGWKLTSTLLFPLLFLFIAMPIWAPLESILQYLTTQVVSFVISLIGVPTYVEGYFIHIPEGRFSIEDVCAGLRYLLATLAISMTYAYLYLKTNKRKMLFIGFSIILSLFINWIRVTSVVLAGHLTNMTHSLVSDHADFGWLLFVFALIPIFWFGGHLIKSEVSEETNKIVPINHRNQLIQQKRYHGTFYLVFSILLLSAIFPLLGYGLKKHSEKLFAESNMALVAPHDLATWAGPFDTFDASFEPRFDMADSKLLSSYAKGVEHTTIFVARYGYQEQGKELISWNNRLFDESRWLPVKKSLRSIKLINNESIEVAETVVVDSEGKNRILWHWYSVAGVDTAKPIAAKMLVIKDIFSNNKCGSSVVLIALDVSNDIESTRKALLDFTREIQSVINVEYNGFT